MKSLFKLMLLPALALAATGCSSDGFDEPNTINPSDQVFLTFDVTTAQIGGRGATQSDGSSTDGNETPSTSENAISSLYVVLTNPTDNKVVAVSQTTQKLNGTEWSAGFNSTEVLGYVDAAPKQVKIYVFANVQPTAVVGTVFDRDQILTGNAWTANNFWMTNAAVSTETSLIYNIPERTELQNHNTPGNPYNLTYRQIMIERICARMDYKQGGPANNSVYNMYKYEYVGENLTKTTDVAATITLTHMALINENTKVYAVRRTSDNGLLTGTNLKYFGAENTTNYMVGWDAADKAAWAATPVAGNYANMADYNNYFAAANYLPTDPTVWTRISDLTTDDNDNGGWAGTPGYKIYSYLLPNVITGANAQLKGLTTGVVFSGRIDAPDGSALKTTMDAGLDIFTYGNLIIGSWAQVGEYVANLGTNGSQLKADYQAAVAEIAGTTDPATIRSIAKNYGFKGIKKQDTMGYRVYYYYWNRHNDNGDPNLMGPMEFSVVRNNVYKLCVTDIEMYGHTASPGDDPDPEDPDDPDESSKIYLKVSLQVLPWVVRINDIIF